ncbi:MAG TPA: shikimate kinase [Gemmatimonadaceae bacterium]|nr:shikimate kinase [Gemmatimonadaceae bacterium]
MPTFRTSQPASAGDPRRPHVILVGLPGSGKTTIGTAVAAKLGRTFLDLDQEIERREGCSVSAIFGEKGEPYFRNLERTVTEELALFGNMILAPGGGWIVQPGVVALLRPPARLIYLKVRPEAALARLGADHVSRPLLARPDPGGELRRLLEARAEAYSSADFSVNTELYGIERVIEKVSTIVTSIGSA